VTFAPSRHDARGPYVAAAVAATALAVDVAVDPAHTHVPLCPLHALTGWSCPLCGSLRAADALAHLQLRDALHDNLLLVAALPFVAWWWVDWCRTARDGRTRPLVPRAVAVALVALGVVFGVLRNLPFAAALRPL
jgi:hypothetical protein